MSIEERLQQAVQAGEVITIIYHGGSQPGSKRQISPFRVSDKDVRARDVVTREAKCYLLSKLEIVPDDSPADEYVAGRVTVKKYMDLEEALQGKIADLTALGWHVEMTDDEISLHRFFKNGKVRRGADVGVMRQEDCATRPWYVYGPDLPTARTYGDLGKAVDLFLSQAVHHAPGTRQAQ